jgi:hypothetical protein
MLMRMEVKGSVVKTIPDFINKIHPDKYEIWLNSLPPESAAIFNGFIKLSDWYPFIEGVHIPTEALGKAAYDGNTLKAAWECGRFSAEITLRGMYKFFVMAAPPSLVVKRGGRILATFYQPSEIIVADEGDGWALLRITKFDELTEVVENRIGGWIEKALEIQNVSQSEITIPKSAARGERITEILIKWGKDNK